VDWGLLAKLMEGLRRKDILTRKREQEVETKKWKKEKKDVLTRFFLSFSFFLNLSASLKI
jgi:hypothetical protein